MGTALIGHGGFVARNLESQAHFDEKVEARAAERLHGRRFDLVVVAEQETRSKANRDPEDDRAAVHRLMEALSGLDTARLLLLSTTDVYARPELVDEDAQIEPASPYGRHRRELERFCRDRHSATVLRLPLAFGPGLQEGVLFKLMLGQRLESTHPDSVCQHYPIAHLWRDANIALERGLAEVNLAVEPLPTRELAMRCFGRELTVYPSSAPGISDVRSKHAPLWGGQPFGYLYAKERVLQELTDFVERERAL
jgi:nucleoside-diphosphate-sugar epimerase